MKKLILLTLFITMNAYADLSGKWIGQGEWTFDGSGSHCFMNLAYAENKDTLSRSEGYFDCDMVGLSIPEAQFKKEGTKLLNENNEVVGSYIGNEINIHEAYNENIDILTTIQVQNLHMDYKEVWTEKDGTILYKITGRLFTNRE
jgi:hypothetical protein